MHRSLRILIISHSDDDVTLIIRELHRNGYEPTYERVETAAAVTQALVKKIWDVIIACDTIPHFDISSGLKTLENSGLDIPFIVISGATSEEIAVASMKAGALDCILKGNMARLAPAIERELGVVEQRQYQTRMEGTLRHVHYYDPLTDLPNLTFLKERLQKTIITAHHESRSIALLMINLNRFSEITETFGHQYGDLLLKEIGPRIRGILHESDVIGRLGGDKFAVLLPTADVEAATQLTRTLLREMETSFLVEGVHLYIGASIGIAVFPDHGEYADLLLRRADIAMHAAKKSDLGYATYTSAMDRANPKRLALATELKHAIQKEELFLLYQPKVELKTGHIGSVEALLRWQHPERGILPPDEFIPLAERSGLINSMTLWVLGAAISQCHVCRQVGKPIVVAVNLSTRSLKDPKIIDNISNLLKTHAVPSQYLKLEITESTLMEDPRRSLEIIKRLKRMGVRISIDDFGTGYSSLSYLKKLPADEIKIDKSFIMDMDQEGIVIVRSTIDLAHNLGITVVAEGVESRDLMDQLAGLGCDEVQGNYISDLLSSDELPLWLIDTAPKNAKTIWRTAL